VDLATGQIASIGGGGQSGPFDPLLTASQVTMDHISAVALDPAGNIYLPLFWGDKGLLIERMTPTGELSVVAGGGAQAVGGVSTSAFQVSGVLCLAVNPLSGEVMVCTPDGHVYRIPAPPLAGP
jgi:hypothetical protein